MTDKSVFANEITAWTSQKFKGRNLLIELGKKIYLGIYIVNLILIEFLYCL
jgi:hypothetical protein